MIGLCSSPSRIYLADFAIIRFHLPRPETKDDILQRTFALFPELAPPETRAKKTATIDDLKEIIIDEGCGLRPARSGGVRVDLRWFEGGEKKLPVISHYGFVLSSLFVDS
jgi:D-amino-acid oxidase